MSGILGPQTNNYSVVRPAQNVIVASGDTWFKDCTSPVAQDGTLVDSDWLNNMVAQLRHAIDGAIGYGISIGRDPTNDDMLWHAIYYTAQKLAIDTYNAQLAAGGMQIFTSSGTFTVPANIRSLRRVRVWGGGGAGGGSTGSHGSGSGGSPGGYSETTAIAVTPGQSITVVVGMGGAPATNPNTVGASGGSSAFGSFVGATGGGGGYWGDNSPILQASPAGSGYGGVLNLTSLTGGYGFEIGALNGIGGGIGGPAPFGGPSPALNLTTAGSPGLFPGGGANGGCNGNIGGAGANGLVIVEY